MDHLMETKNRVCVVCVLALILLVAACALPHASFVSSQVEPPMGRTVRLVDHADLQTPACLENSRSLWNQFCQTQLLIWRRTAAFSASMLVFCPNTHTYTYVRSSRSLPAQELLLKNTFFFACASNFICFVILLHN